MTLIDYIQKHYGGNQAAFAKAQEVKPQQVTQWINKGFIVIGNKLYSPGRELRDKGFIVIGHKLYSPVHNLGYKRQMEKEKWAKSSPILIALLCVKYAAAVVMVIKCKQDLLMGEKFTRTEKTYMSCLFGSGDAVREMSTEVFFLDLFFYLDGIAETKAA